MKKGFKLFCAVLVGASMFSLFSSNAQAEVIYRALPNSGTSYISNDSVEHRDAVNEACGGEYTAHYSSVLGSYNSNSLTVEAHTVYLRDIVGTVFGGPAIVYMSDDASETIADYSYVNAEVIEGERARFVWNHTMSLGSNSSAVIQQYFYPGSAGDIGSSCSDNDEIVFDVGGTQSGSSSPSLNQGTLNNYEENNNKLSGYLDDSYYERVNELAGSVSTTILDNDSNFALLQQNTSPLELNNIPSRDFESKNYKGDTYQVAQYKNVKGETLITAQYESDGLFLTLTTNLSIDETLELASEH